MELWEEKNQTLVRSFFPKNDYMRSSPGVVGCWKYYAGEGHSEDKRVQQFRACTFPKRMELGIEDLQLLVLREHRNDSSR